MAQEYCRDCILGVDFSISNLVKRESSTGLNAIVYRLQEGCVIIFSLALCVLGISQSLCLLHLQ